MAHIIPNVATAIEAGFSPSSYTPSPVGVEPNSRVSAHLSGIDKAISNINSISKIYSQSSTGFSVGDVVRWDASSSALVKAIADSESNSRAIGIIGAKTDDTITVVYQGYIEIPGSSLSSGSVYYLSTANAGEMTTTEPTTVGYVKKPIFIATSTSSGIVINVHGTVISATQYAISKRTEGESSPYNITASDVGKLFTNEGATAKAYLNLPEATEGYFYSFCIQDDDGMRITAASGDVICLYNLTTNSGGYVESASTKSSLTLVAINSTEWIATSIIGYWTLSN